MAAEKINRAAIKAQIDALLFNTDKIYKIVSETDRNGTILEQRKKFEKFVRPYLSIEHLLNDSSNVCYDVIFDGCYKIIVYIICDKTILTNYSAGDYIANRTDILADLIRDAFSKKYQIVAVETCDSDNFYGLKMTFLIP